MANLTEEDLKNMSPEEIQELQKKNCVFCQIISGKIPAYKIFEDDKVVAILDINPANEGHVLLLPKEHYQILPQIPPDLLGHMIIIAKKISQMMLSTMKAKGTSLYFEVGAVAGQKAPHVMLHIIPSSPDKKILQPETKKISIEDFDKALNMLRAKTGFKVVNNINAESAKSPEQPVQQESAETKIPKQEPVAQEKTSKQVESPKNKTDNKVVDNNITNKSSDNKKVDLDKISKLFG